MDSPSLAERLRSETRFRELVHVAACDSTQDLALEVEGDAVVWADEQQAGRGRLGRAWHGAPGLDVETTFRIEGLQLDDPAILAAAVPTAVAEALEPLAGQPIRIDWPNDVLCAGRKLAGVLIDATGNPPSRLFVGIGVNVNRTTFPAELLDSATSLRIATGDLLDREDVLLRLARAVDRAVADLGRGEEAHWAEAFRSRLGLLGRRVRIAESERELTGRLTAIDLRRAEIDGLHSVRLALVRSLGPG